MVEWRRVVPPLAERLDEIGDRRATDLGLHVVPRWAVAVPTVEGDRLRVAAVVVVVVPTVAEVDAPDERDGTAVVVAPVDDDQLLVMAAGPSDPLVEQDLCAPFVELACQRRVVLLREVRLARVRAPDEAAQRDPAPYGGQQEGVEGRSRPQPLVAVALPVGQGDRVRPLRGPHDVGESPEVVGAVDVDRHGVARRPGRGAVEGGGGVGALAGPEEPRGGCRIRR